MLGGQRGKAVRVLALAAAWTTAPAWAGEYVRVETVVMLPEPVANNAVAALKRKSAAYLYSFNGLGAGKTWKDVKSSAWEVNLKSGAVSRLPDVPGDRGRLASVAVGLHDRAFIFGGYTVAEDGSEKSTPEVYAFNPETRSYERRADMPVPVDDTVALPYANRYIYLISGWHDTGNVSHVQVLDTWEDKWLHATDFPGTPVFGHSGGIVDNLMVIADGVKVAGKKKGKRQFTMSDEVWTGEIDISDPAKIAWTRQKPHPGPPLYRMAAAGSGELGAVVFAGGSATPYNYNGVGYDGTPAVPSQLTFQFDSITGAWRQVCRRIKGTMDHRGLLEAGGTFHIIGGMDRSRAVRAEVLRLHLNRGPTCLALP